jgi:lysophospholipase L1-like esterase
VIGPASAVPPPRRDILLVGDSITTGAVLGRNRDSIPERLARMRPGWFIADVSRGGMGVAHGAWPAFNVSLLRWFNVRRENVVVLLGVNDFMSSVPLDTFETAYTTLAATALDENEQLVCVTPVWAGPSDRVNLIGAVLEDYRMVIRSVCAVYGFPVIEGDPLVPHDAAFYAEDDPMELHPNARGCRWFARNLAFQLDPVLR